VARKLPPDVSRPRSLRRFRADGDRRTAFRRQRAHLADFLLSCRVMGRNIEENDAPCRRRALPRDSRDAAGRAPARSAEPPCSSSSGDPACARGVDRFIWDASAPYACPGGSRCGPRRRGHDGRTVAGRVKVDTACETSRNWPQRLRETGKTDDSPCLGVSVAHSVSRSP